MPAAAAWTRDEVLAAIRRWVAMYGEPPVRADWQPAQARSDGTAWRVERMQAHGPWPTAHQVAQLFDGGMPRAIQLAGFRPKGPGRRPAGYQPRLVPLTIPPPIIPAADDGRFSRNGHEPERAVAVLERDGESLKAQTAATVAATQRAEATERALELARLAARQAEQEAAAAGERAREAERTAEAAMAAQARAEADLQRMAERVSGSHGEVEQLRARLAAAQRGLSAVQVRASDAEDALAAARERRASAPLSLTAMADLAIQHKGASGEGPLGEALRELAKVRKRREPGQLAPAVLRVAAAAAAWHRQLV